MDANEDTGHVRVLQDGTCVTSLLQASQPSGSHILVSPRSTDEGHGNGHQDGTFVTVDNTEGSLQHEVRELARMVAAQQATITQLSQQWVSLQLSQLTSVQQTQPPVTSTPASARPHPGGPGRQTWPPSFATTNSISQGHPKTRLPKFDGSATLSSFLSQFEVVADAEGWSESDKAAQLVSSLRGEAVDVLGSLTDAQRRRYHEVKAALDQRYGEAHQVEMYRAQLRARYRAEGETLRQLAADVERLVRRAYAGMEEKWMVELVIQHFADALDNLDMELHLKQAKPTSLSEALARALEYEAWTMARPRHYERSSRPVTRTTSPRRNRSTEKADRTGASGKCWECREEGHRSSGCPHRRCYRCDKKGHIARDCRQDDSSLSENEEELGVAGGPSPARKTSAPKVPQDTHTQGRTGKKKVISEKPCNRPECQEEQWVRRGGPSASTREPAVRAYGGGHRVGKTLALVEGSIDGKKCVMTVDTGAERTFVQKGIIKGKLPRHCLPLCGATGECSPLWGPVEVRMRVGEFETVFPVLVGGIRDTCLLGLDFLDKMKADISLKKRALTLAGVEVPFVFPGIHAVTLRRVKVEPWSGTRVRCRLTRKLEGECGLVEPRESATTEWPIGMAVGRSLVRGADDEVSVLVVNDSDSHVTINAGVLLGVCEEVVRAPWPGREAVQVHRTGEETAGEKSNVERRDGVPGHLTDMLERSGKDLSEEKMKRLKRLLCEFGDVFSKDDNDLGRTDLVQHRINTGDAAPIKQAPRRIAPARRKETEEAVRKLAEQGTIERSSSPWSSAIVLVKKKDGSFRCCVDYRALNDVTTKDSYPLPRVDDTLDALKGAKWFSSLDLKSGFHQVEMASEDKEKTAFSFGQGLWQYRVMPFGLCNSPATFERLMERVLEGLLGRTALVYLDDVVVYGQTFMQEVERLEEVFWRMRSANLRLNPKKCTLFQREVSFLGHIVSEKGVQTDPKKVEDVQKWPEPRNVKELRSFLGLCTYYRRFVRDFAAIASPLHRLTGKVDFEWSPDCQKAFQRLKQALVSSPVLAYPDPELPYVLDTDASNEGLGAVLSQQMDAVERPVAFYSRKLSAAEKNYCVTRRELLAIVEATKHFHHYLYGAQFKIRTDHAALRWLKTLKNPEAQLARWLGRLEQLNYNVEHRAGRVHGNADSLSRRPCEPECGHCSKREAVECKRGEGDESSEMEREPEEEVEEGPAVEEESEELSEWAVWQREDPDLRTVIEWMERGEGRPTWEEALAEGTVTRHYWHTWKSLKLDEEGVLVRRWTECDGSACYWQTVVPWGKREEVLKGTHDGIGGGHLGEKKTLDKLRQRMYWVNMREDVQQWCKTCTVCNAKKGPPRRGCAPMKLHCVGKPLDRFAVDIAGPFPTTPNGNRFVLVAMDYFTKWPEAFALPNHEAVTVARVLVGQVFTRIGLPDELHSDQGREFESKVFQECCRLLGIRKTRTTALHPQGNGMVERWNRTMQQHLAKYCEEKQSDWDEHLPMLLMAYRSAKHEATGCTPAKMMFGRELRLPIDLATGRPPDEELPTTSTAFVQTLKERLESTHRFARQKLKLAGEAMRKRHDRGAKEVPYQVGDLVWLHNPARKKGLSPKLQSDWEGPYTVVQLHNDVDVRIRREGRRKSKMVHADRLTKYYGPGEFSWGRGRSEETDEPLQEEEEEEVGLPDWMTEEVDELPAGGMSGSEDDRACEGEELQPAPGPSDALDEVLPAAPVPKKKGRPKGSRKQQTEPQPNAALPAETHRPTRTRKPPARFQDYTTGEEFEVLCRAEPCYAGDRGREWWGQVVECLCEGLRGYAPEKIARLEARTERLFEDARSLRVIGTYANKYEPVWSRKEAEKTRGHIKCEENEWRWRERNIETKWMDLIRKWREYCHERKCGEHDEMSGGTVSRIKAAKEDKHVKWETRTLVQERLFDQHDPPRAVSHGCCSGLAERWTVSNKEGAVLCPEGMKPCEGSVVERNCGGEEGRDGA